MHIFLFFCNKVKEFFGFLKILTNTNKEDLNYLDTNGDGEIDLNEAFAAFEKYQNVQAMRQALTVFNRDNFFSNDGNFNHL